ncbi:uncharacterized protein LOC134848200 isoform X3 [Symsagittifera roscoffensis]|uniref:uncharacterized protein LOC134848200 isoform X3 n=1 Tax=Symsagittifera roscoffensis TaxID=84072 RepID=UPI00307C4FCF
MESTTEEEFGILRSIFGDEVSILESDPCQVSMQLTPSTADDASKKHVCMSVIFTIPATYPHEKPIVTFKNVRGLSQTLESDLVEKLGVLMEARLGSAMLFDAIDFIKDFLTANNHPSVECAICLEAMNSDSAFIKTTCFHYFHPWCLSQYLKSTQQVERDENTDPETVEKTANACPICRTQLELTVEHLDSFEKPEETNDGSQGAAAPIQLGEEFRKFQQQMQQLLEKQKEQGGIIDPSSSTNVVIDVSSASKKSSNHSSDSSNQPSTSTIGGELSNEELKGPNTLHSDEAQDFIAAVPSQTGPELKVGSFVSRRGYTKNLNSSYPLNSTFRKSTSKEINPDFRPRNLSASYSVGSSEPPAPRIDHKYHDGRWRPRKKHDFEIRAELLEKSRSLDEQNLAAEIQEEAESSVVAETSVKASNSADQVPRPSASASNSSVATGSSKQGSKDSIQSSIVEFRNDHSNLQHTVSSPGPIAERTMSGQGHVSPRTDPMSQPITRRVKKKPPLSVTAKSNFSGNLSHTYSESDYYSNYGYDYRGGSEHWYYGNGSGNSSEGFYGGNNPEIYRNRHSYHGNNKRGKTGYQGRKGHNSSGDT